MLVHQGVDIQNDKIRQKQLIDVKAIHDISDQNPSVILDAYKPMYSPYYFPVSLLNQM